jgi:hypothetical protein
MLFRYQSQSRSAGRHIIASYHEPFLVSKGLLSIRWSARFTAILSLRVIIAGWRK